MPPCISIILSIKEHSYFLESPVQSMLLIQRVWYVHLLTVDFESSMQAFVCKSSCHQLQLINAKHGVPRKIVIWSLDWNMERLDKTTPTGSEVFFKVSHLKKKIKHKKSARVQDGTRSQFVHGVQLRSFFSNKIQRVTTSSLQSSSRNLQVGRLTMAL